MKAALAAAFLSLGAAASPKPTVAVLYFDYNGKNEELAQLRKGLAQMVITDLSANTAFQIVERSRLQKILDELKLNQTNKIDPATANKIGKLLGAKYMVMGSYTDVLGTLRVDATVVEVATSAVLHGSGTKAIGKPEDFLDLQQKISRDLDAFLARTADVPPSNMEGKRLKKLPVKAVVRYARALDAIDRKDTATAKKELEAVVKEQPDFVLAAADLAALVK